MTRTITGISLQNFKGFKKQDDIQLAPLTFLVGPNSSGKSSILSALSLLAQSEIHASEIYESQIVWAGDLVDLGSYADVAYAHNERLKISIGTTLNVNNEGPIKFRVTIRKSSHSEKTVVSSIEVSDILTGEKVSISPRTHRNQQGIRLSFLGEVHDVFPPSSSKESFYWKNHLYYLIPSTIKKVLKVNKEKLRGKMAGWSRIARYIESPYYSMRFFRTIQRVASGRNGPSRWYSVEEASDQINRFNTRKFDGVSPAMIEYATKKGQTERSPFADDSRAKPLFEIEEILRALNIASVVTPDNLSPYHTAINVVDNLSNIESNLIDVGYGASQILPVISALRSSSSGPLLIEQPEIHLHPQAQGTIGTLICQVSRKRQVLVETHSVHMINRARLEVAEGKLKPSDVRIVYVDRNKSGSYVEEIPILADGSFGAEWPDGFFEERYEDSMRLLSAKNRQS